MTDLRENLGWVIGSVLVAIVAFLGWFYESGLLNTVIGIMIGAGIAFFVQTKTQKRAWKREYAIKVVEEVYAPLFKDLKNIVKGLEERDYRGQWSHIWGEIQDSHKYLMIDEPFRTKMDNLNEALHNYSLAVSKIRGDIIPKIFSEEARRIFKLDTNVRTQISVKAGNVNYGLGDTVVTCLLKGKHLKEEVFKSYPELKNIESYEFQTEEGKGFHTHEIEKFEDFWKSCVMLIKENPTVQAILKENERLLADARRLKEEITKRIKEPWKI